MKRWLRLKRAGVRRPQVVISEARRADLRLADALAMLHNETGIPQQNIFGCDHGAGRAFCHEQVTQTKVRKLLLSPYSNGVGWTQLTYRPFVSTAQRLGGAHRPKLQCRVGFRVLKDNMVRTGSRWAGFKAYNGTGTAADAYASRAIARAAGWQRVIDGKQSNRPS
jgi:hypothetical protein